MKLKKNTELFLRSMYITAIIVVCLAVFIYGISAAYENTVNIGFGEYKKAVGFADGVLRILDFEIKLF